LNIYGLHIVPARELRGTCTRQSGTSSRTLNIFVRRHSVKLDVERNVINVRVQEARFEWSGATGSGYDDVISSSWKTSWTICFRVLTFQSRSLLQGDCYNNNNNNNNNYYYYNYNHRHHILEILFILCFSVVRPEIQYASVVWNSVRSNYSK